MNKRSFILGIFVGILLSIAFFLLLPLANRWLENRSTIKISSTQDYVQEFADAITTGDYKSIWVNYGINDSKDSCGQYYNKDMRPFYWFPSENLSTTYDHVPIKLISSKQITQADKVNGVNKYEFWCADFIGEGSAFPGQGLTDMSVIIEVLDCKGLNVIMGVDIADCP